MKPKNKKQKFRPSYPHRPQEDPIHRRRRKGGGGPSKTAPEPKLTIHITEETVTLHTDHQDAYWIQYIALGCVMVCK